MSLKQCRVTVISFVLYLCRFYFMRWMWEIACLVDFYFRFESTPFLEVQCESVKFDLFFCISHGIRNKVYINFTVILLILFLFCCGYLYIFRSALLSGASSIRIWLIVFRTNSYVNLVDAFKIQDEPLHMNGLIQTKLISNQWKGNMRNGVKVSITLFLFIFNF